MSDNSCRDFERRIHDLMDLRESLTDDAELAAHASQCVVCSALLRDYSRLETIFENGNHDIGYFDSGNYPAYVEPDKPAVERTPFVLQRLAPWSAMASLFLVAITAALLWNPSPEASQLADAGSPARVETAGDVSSGIAEVNSTQERGGLNAAVEFVYGIRSQLEDPYRQIRPFSELPDEIGSFNDMGSFDAVYKLSAELPGIRPINVTWNILSETFSGESESEASDAPTTEQSDSDDGTSYRYVQLCSVV